MSLSENGKWWKLKEGDVFVTSSGYVYVNTKTTAVSGVRTCCDKWQSVTGTNKSMHYLQDCTLLTHNGHVLSVCMFHLRNQYSDLIEILQVYRGLLLS